MCLHKSKPKSTFVFERCYRLQAVLATLNGCFFGFRIMITLGEICFLDEDAIFGDPILILRLFFLEISGKPKAA